ncbi:MAG: DUF1579 family protein [Actinobacteria bacterium]|nr:DUF1579 family protein [Actinomycetota bacterium]
MSSDIMQAPQPDPRLNDLEPLIGTWRLVGHLTGSDEENITGRTTFSWLPGGFFMQQVAEINFLGTVIRSHEIIGYDQARDAFTSSVYSNLSPEPWPYTWDVAGDELRILVSSGPLDATFTGSLSRFTGEWKPNPGADPQANVAYAIRSERIDD